MHIVAFLVDLRRYRDRVLMWQHAAERVGRMTLLTATPPPADLNLPPSSALRIVPLADRPLRRQPARRALMRWWRAQRQAPDLLHDSQGFMLPLFALLQLQRRRPVRLSTNFASTWDWFTHLRGQHAVEWGVREARYWSFLALEWSLARVTDAFTVFGEGHRATFARAYQVPEARVFSIPNCMDSKGFSPDGPRADLPPGDPVLLFVGDLFRYKGVHELLEATAALPRTRLWLVGDAPGAAGEAVQAHIQALGLGSRVQITGPVPHQDLPALMRAAAMVVLPSYTEGSPRVLIEAMACGRPIVGTDIPGITTLDPEGTCIARVPRGDAAALTAALARLLADPAAAEAAGARARQRYLAHHTPEAAGEVLAALYRQLAC